MADSGLAAAGRPDQRKGRAGGNVHRDIGQHRILVAVAEGDMPQRHRARDPADRLRLRQIDLLRHIHDFHIPLKARNAALELLHETDERVDGIEKQADRHHKSGIVGKGNAAPVQKQTACNEDDHIENIGNKGRRGMKLAHRAVGIAACLAEILVALLKFFDLQVGVRERLCHADAGNAALQRGVDLGDGLTAFLKRAAHLIARQRRNHHQKRHTGKHDERQSDMDAQKIRKRDNDGDGAGNRHLRPVVRQLAYIGQIIREPRHDFARFVRVEKGKRQPLQVCKQITAHLRLHPHAHHVPLILDEEIEQHPHKVNEQQAQPIDHHKSIAPVRDKIAEHQARDDGIENAHERHGERRRHVHGEKPFVRAIIGKKPFEHVITYITFIIYISLYIVQLSYRTAKKIARKKAPKGFFQRLSAIS